MIIFTLHLSALVVLSWFVARRVYESSLDKILATFVLVWSNTVLTALFLSCFSLLGDRVWYFRASILMAVLFALSSRFFAQRQLPSSYPEVSESASSVGLKWLRRGIVGSFIVFFGLNLLVCLKYSPNNWDSLTYHLPRIHFYLSQGHLGHFDTINLRQIFFPFNATLFQAFLVIYGQSDKLLNCFNLLSWMIASTAVYALSRRCGVNHTASLVAAWIGAFSGQVFAQATATTNDLLAAAPLLAGTVFAIDWWRNRLRLLALLSAAAFGLAFGTKLTMYFFIPALAIFACLWLLGNISTKKRVAIGRQDVLQIIGAMVLVVILATPFLAINYCYTKQFSPEHYSFLLNRPWSLSTFLQTIYTYTLALLIDPVQYFALRADSAWKFRISVEPFVKKMFFPFWDRESAVNDLYVFGTDISEDGVFYGFSILLILLASGYLFCKREFRTRLPMYCAAVGFGWFITYTMISKWSLFNQRYFIAAFLLCMPLVGLLFNAALASPPARGRNLILVLFGFVAMSSLLFSYSYLFYNTPRSIRAISSPQFNKGKIPISPAFESAIAIPRKVRFVFSGYTHEDERLYQLMNRGKGQLFSIGQQRADDWYNVFTFWAPVRQSMYWNIPSSSAYTVISIPGKKSAGVEKLGEFGDGMNRYHYYGLAPTTLDSIPTVKNANIIIRTLFDRFASGNNHLRSRLLSFRLETVGLNVQDDTVLKIYYTDMNNINHLLAQTTHDYSAAYQIPVLYKRLYFEASPVGSRKIIATSEIRIDEYGRSGPAEVKEIAGDFDLDLITDPSPYGAVLSGLGPPDGPYLQWQLPNVRWATERRVTISFALAEEHRKNTQVQLQLSFRPQVRKSSRMDIIANGVFLKTYHMIEDKQWIDADIVFCPVRGRNEIEFLISGALPDEKPPTSNLHMLFRKMSLKTIRQ